MEERKSIRIGIWERVKMNFQREEKYPDRCLGDDKDKYFKESKSIQIKISVSKRRKVSG